MREKSQVRRQGSQTSSERTSSSPSKFSEKEIFDLKPEERELFKHAKNWERITCPTFHSELHTLDSQETFEEFVSFESSL